MLKINRVVLICFLLVMLTFVSVGFANNKVTTADPYAAGKVSFDPYFKKVDINGKLVVVLNGTVNKRELKLIKPPSRGVVKYQVHELILTDEQEAAPGKIVDKVAYLGFVEFTNGGVLLNGDIVLINGRQIGYLVGYDETHMPNHQNIVIKTNILQSGKDLKLKPGDRISFVHNK